MRQQLLAKGVMRSVSNPHLVTADQSQGLPSHVMPHIPGLELLVQVQRLDPNPGVSVPIACQGTYIALLHLPHKDLTHTLPSGHCEQEGPSLYGFRPFTLPLDAEDTKKKSVRKEGKCQPQRGRFDSTGISQPWQNSELMLKNKN